MLDMHRKKGVKRGENGSLVATASSGPLN